MRRLLAAPAASIFAFGWRLRWRDIIPQNQTRGRPIKGSTFIATSAAATGLVAIYFVVLWTMKASTGLPLIYALDDAYIHMALAKNMHLHGVHGISPDEFSSPSSSILWPLMLLIFRLFGIGDYGPLLLNIIGTYTLAYVVGWIIQRELKASPVAASGMTLALLLVLPSTALALGGMEHIWHSTAMLLFFYSAIVQLSETEAHPRQDVSIGILLLGCFLSTALRFESVFAVFTFAVLSMLLKRRRLALALIVIGSLPILAFAAFSLINGGLHLPFSVISKSVSAGLPLHKIAVNAAIRLAELDFKRTTPLPLICVLCLVSLFIQPLFANQKLRLSCLALLAIVFLHIMFVDFGWLFRYESYLVAIAGVLLVFSTKPLLTLKIGHHPSQRFLWGAIAGLIILGGSFRAYRGIKYTARAMNERAVEHLPVAKFIRTFYNADTIILGDIGMVTYLTEAKVLDVFGLANRDSCVEILQARSTAEVGKVGAEFLSQWQKTRAAKLAVIRSNWVRSIPSDWIRVATFKIDSNIVFGDISPLIFFAFDRDAASELRDNLQTFGAAEAISGRLHLTL